MQVHLLVNTRNSTLLLVSKIPIKTKVNKRRNIGSNGLRSRDFLPAFPNIHRMLIQTFIPLDDAPDQKAPRAPECSKRALVHTSAVRSREA